MEVNNISNTTNVNTNESYKINNNIKINSNSQNNSDKKVFNAGEKESINRDSLDKIVSEANEKYKLASKELSYDIHEETNRITVTIKDSESGDVIKQIPSEESLELSAKIKEMVGLLIDEQS